MSAKRSDRLLGAVGEVGKVDDVGELGKGSVGKQEEEDTEQLDRLTDFLDFYFNAQLVRHGMRPAYLLQLSYQPAAERELFHTWRQLLFPDLNFVLLPQTNPNDYQYLVVHQSKSNAVRNDLKQQTKSQDPAWLGHQLGYECPHPKNDFGSPGQTFVGFEISYPLVESKRPIKMTLYGFWCESDPSSAQIQKWTVLAKEMATKLSFPVGLLVRKVPSLRKNKG
jgi:hypothetical protein